MPCAALGSRSPYTRRPASTSCCPEQSAGAIRGRKSTPRYSVRRTAGGREAAHIGRPHPAELHAPQSAPIITLDALMMAEASLSGARPRCSAELLVITETISVPSALGSEDKLGQIFSPSPAGNMNARAQCFPAGGIDRDQRIRTVDRSSQ